MTAKQAEKFWTPADDAKAQRLAEHWVRTVAALRSAHAAAERAIAHFEQAFPEHDDWSTFVLEPSSEPTPDMTDQQLANSGHEAIRQIVTRARAIAACD